MSVLDFFPLCKRGKVVEVKIGEAIPPGISTSAANNRRDCKKAVLDSPGHLPGVIYVKALDDGQPFAVWASEIVVV